jgi:hypothetical protein
MATLAHAHEPLPHISRAPDAQLCLGKRGNHAWPAYHVETWQSRLHTGSLTGASRSQKLKAIVWMGRPRAACYRTFYVAVAGGTALTALLKLLAVRG